jgi:hypothetical protein
VRTIEHARTRVVALVAAVVVLGAAIAAVAWRSGPKPVAATVASPTAAPSQTSVAPRQRSTPTLPPSPTPSPIPFESGPYSNSEIGFFVAPDFDDPWSAVLRLGDTALLAPGTVGFGWPCGMTAYRDGCSDMVLVASARAGAELIVGTRSCADIAQNPIEAAICDAEGGPPPATISGGDVKTLEQAWRAAFVHDGPVSAEDGTVGGAAARILVQRHRLVVFVDAPRGIVVIEMTAGGLVADAVAVRERRFRTFLERFRLLPAPDAGPAGLSFAP